MKEIILELLVIFPVEIQVLILSMIPITELRATIPIAIGMGMDPLTAFIYAIIGNFIPIIPLLLFLPLVLNLLQKNNLTKKIVQRILDRTQAKSGKVQKYGAIGLLLFVAVPLPGTGIWSGCLAALLFGIPFKFAFPAITFGMLIAGIVVTLASVGVLQLFQHSSLSLILLFGICVLISFIIYKYKARQ